MAFERLKSLLKNELGYLPDGDGLEVLFSRGETMNLSRGGIVIEEGMKCPDVYIVEDGIVRFVDMNGDKERTFGFGLPGTMFSSKHSFVMNLPSYYRVEACCPTTLMHIKKDDFWDVVTSYHELTIWMLQYAYGELFFQEYKNAVVHNGSTAERYRRMIGDRPEIMEKVSQKNIASYLGVTPEYLSKLKREFLKSRR
ncbi:Crp/Fnr family transcriptional regulator [Barnesiella sp. WM24]|uniref:Crp/Fnr family transcriptional regulator n=1 Tax=Barnesiella sp. WM24 TaxID=2558278 RepID=UPI0014302D06|nr:Crp/Fnr family transcriptional regulator [Barnesiella sp. WM24]MDE6114787.1 Crp/Fnr family transcriptional regulator [Muribaculum sp.]